MACRSPCSSILLRPMMMMMVMVSSLLVWGVGHGMAQPDDYAAPEMDTVESEAVYRILESINSGVPWRALHPNNLCLYGPHGLACEAEKEETKKKTNSNSSNNSSSSSEIHGAATARDRSSPDHHMNHQHKARKISNTSSIATMARAASSNFSATILPDARSTRPCHTPSCPRLNAL